MKGYSLKEDLRSLINNQKYSDIKLLCKDEKKLYGCRAILAARSEVFNSLLYNGMKETYENQISFPEINSVGMEIILEYTYTGSVEKEYLTKENIVEAFYAADYFQLPDLQDFIMKIVIEITLKDNYAENYSPELLSKAVEKMPPTDDNILLNLLIERIEIMPLNTIEFNRLSIEGLECLLSCTHEKEEPFVTPEYEVFRYSAILAAKQVSDDAYKTLMSRLPTLEQLENSIQLENKFIPDRQKIAKELEPLIKFIDFGLIKAQILTDIIKPLEIIPAEIVSSVYQHKALSNNSDFRGAFYFWDKSACEPRLIIENNGKVVLAQSCVNLYRNVRAKIALENKGIFEWDVIIERVGAYASVGVCASEDFNYRIFTGSQPTAWVLDSNGCCWNNYSKVSNYCQPFSDDTKVTVHLNMNKRSLAFTVNGTKYPEIPSWTNLPSKLYPVVSLSLSLHKSARIRIKKTGL